jgi:formylglycine-generating enzyme required for sulfatase activity
VKKHPKNYPVLLATIALTAIHAWGADGPLPAVAESQSRIGNVKGSLIKGTLITTYDASKQDQEWYAVTLAQPSPVGWVVFTHGIWSQNGGWFDASKGKPQVQIQAVKDGPWTTVGELSDYPATTATDNKSFPNYSRFACTITPPVTALSVRVIGRAASGDSAKNFSSSAGLAVYTSPIVGGVTALPPHSGYTGKPSVVIDLKFLDSKLKVAGEQIPVLYKPTVSGFPYWFNNMKQWRELKLAEMKYDGAEYNRPELTWCQRAFVQTQLMVEDRYLYDVKTGTYTVGRYLDDLEKRYGGIDTVVVWPSHANTGIDNQNPFDQFRALPGGAAAVKQMVADFHQRGVKVLFAAVPLSQGGLRDEGVPFATAMTRDLQAIGADGIFGAAMTSMPKEYPTASGQAGAVLAFQPENGLQAGEADLPWITMSRGKLVLKENSVDLLPLQVRVPPPVGISKYKWLEPRHMVNLCNPWFRDKNIELQHAFFNGIGFTAWENNWGIWNGLTPRDGESLRRITTIMRAFPELLTSKDWEPNTPTLQTEIYASRFPGARQTLWTLINRRAFQVTGPQLRVPFSATTRYFDLWHGVELKPMREGDEQVLSFEIETYGFGAVLAVDGTPDPELNTLLAKMSAFATKRLEDYSGEWACLTQTQVPIAATAPVKAAPAGMTRIPGGTFDFCVDGIEVEGGNQLGVDVQYPWENSPRRNHRQFVTLKPFYIDTYPVTNEQFKKFVDATKYHPRDDYNFLKDWKNGTYPEGWAKKPVTWVSSEDARAYAAWAGKRLPHETEWQFAAQGTDGRLYPWGNELNTDAIPPECKDKELRPPTDVDAFPKGASPFGVMDMVGNVWQWTDEYLDDHTRSGILRGGSYFKPQGSDKYFPNKIELNTHGKLLLMAPSKDRAGTLGFRCAVDAAE